MSNSKVHSCCKLLLLCFLSCRSVSWRGPNELLSHFCFVEFAGGEVEGFVLEPKRRNKVIEEYNTVSRCYEFSASGTCREARLRAERSKTSHSSSTTAGFFSYWSASEPCWRSCRGITYILACYQFWINCCHTEGTISMQLAVWSYWIKIELLLIQVCSYSSFIELIQGLQAADSVNVWKLWFLSLDNLNLL